MDKLKLIEIQSCLGTIAEGLQLLNNPLMPGVWTEQAKESYDSLVKVNELVIELLKE